MWRIFHAWSAKYFWVSICRRANTFRMLSGWKGAVILIHPLCSVPIFITSGFGHGKIYLVLHSLIATSSMNLMWFLESWWCEQDVYCVRLKHTIILHLWWAAKLILPGLNPRSFVFSLVLTLSLIMVAIITGLIVVKFKGIFNQGFALTFININVVNLNICFL